MRAWDGGRKWQAGNVLTVGNGEVPPALLEALLSAAWWRQFPFEGGVPHSARRRLGSELGDVRCQHSQPHRLCPFPPSHMFLSLPVWKGFLPVLLEPA